MSNLNQLRERRATLVNEVRNALDQNKGATWGEEHQKLYDNSMTEIDRIDAQLKREQDFLNLSAEKAFKEMGGVIVENGGTPKDDAKDIFNKWMRGGDKALSAAEWQTVRNTMSTTTNTEGGYTVPTTVAPELINALKAFGGMRQAATSFTTAGGESINWPTNDDTASVGEIIAENASATDLDPTFGTVSMAAYKYSSKVVTVPWELMQDSVIDVQGMVTGLLANRIGRILNTHFTTGTGTGQPRGIVTASALGKTGATSQTTTVTYDDLVDLEHSLDPAYRDGASFMMNDASVKVVRKIKDSQQRPIFVPGYESGSPGGAPSSLLGRPIVVNNDVAVMAANAKSILFGNFKNYRIRDVMGYTLFRFDDSAYAKKGQVGFLAWSRHGGNLIDISGATVKHYANSAT